MIIISNSLIFQMGDWGPQRLPNFSKTHISLICGKARTRFQPPVQWSCSPLISSFSTWSKKRRKKNMLTHSLFSLYKNSCCTFTMLEGIFKFSFPQESWGKIIWFLNRKAIIIIIIYSVSPKGYIFKPLFRNPHKRPFY